MIKIKEREATTEVRNILKKKHTMFVLNMQLIKMVEIGDLVEVEQLIN